MSDLISRRSLLESRAVDLGAAVKSRPGSRSFRQGYVTWCVYEDRHPNLGDSLIFESDRIARRVRNYPANWRDLSDEQLAVLSLSR